MPERQSEGFAPGHAAGSSRTAAKMAVGKPPRERRKADPSIKPAVERRSANLALKAAEERRLAALTARPGTGKPIEQAVEQSKAQPKFEPDAQLQVQPQPKSGRIERRKADPATKPQVERRRAKSAAKPPEHAPLELDAAAKPAVERRKAHASAKPPVERRRAKSTRKAAPEAAVPGSFGTPADCAPIPASAMATAAVQSEPEAVAQAPGDSIISERRVTADRRASNLRNQDLEDHLRSQEQQNRFVDTATWMRKAGAVLIGLNALTVIAVLLLGHAHVSQLNEMRRATAASGHAAYVACLGTQTARNVLVEMKAARMAPYPIPVASAPPLRAAGSAPAQIVFDLEKTASMDPHVPVLFHFAVQNTGRGPALHARVWGAVKLVDAEKEPDFKYHAVALTRPVFTPTDAAAKIVAYSEDAGGLVPLSDADLQRVKSGAAYVVAYGRVVYQDQSGARHEAEFCRHITEPSPGHHDFARCNAYNRTGEKEQEVNEPTKAPELLKASAQKTSPIQNASISLPEIACEVPKQTKN